MIGRLFRKRSRHAANDGARRLRIACRDRRGVAAIEMALTFPVLILFIIGLIEVSRILWTDNALQLAVDDAGRYALANPTATSEQITDFATSKLVSVDASQVTVSVTLETSAGVNFVTITATIPYTSLTQLLPLGTINLTGRSRVPRIG